MEGNVQTEYASLSGKIHTLVIDKTLSISGAAADAKAVREAIDKAVTEEVVDRALEALGDVAEDTARKVTEEMLPSEVDRAVAEMTAIQSDKIKEICV